jgi:SHS2 domain-containing protein
MFAPGYEIVDHPADVGVRAFGKTLPEVLANACMGFVAILIEPSSVRPTTDVLISLNSLDREALLYSLISELIYLFDAEKFLCSTFRDIRIEQQDGGVSFQAHALGETFDSSQHQIKTYVKAMTYHRLSITEGDTGFTAEYVIDI